MDEAAEAPEIKETYSASLSPNSRALRDAFLRQFSKDYKIGKLFSSSGDVLFEGRTTIEWTQFFKVIPLNGLKSPTIPQLQELFLRLAEAYHQASSFHSSLSAAASSLESIIDDKEADYIDNEMKQYRPGGKYWDRNANKLIEKRPGKDLLEKAAQQTVSAMRRALRDLKMEVSFFEHILASLESQRRCFKDHAELYRVTGGSGF